jgi:glucose-6-phosphate 1-epimerase
VPVLFPQFSELGALPKHGFARGMPWTLMRDECTALARTVVYQLDLSPDQIPGWPHAARLVLRAIAEPNAFSLRLQVTNTGGSAFSWTGGLHPYFAVQDVRHCQLTGLAGLAVSDRYDLARREQDQELSGQGTQPLECLYDGCPALTLFTGTHRLTLEATGFDQWMVWNPGESGGQALPDLPAQDWSRFLCVEPVRVARPVVLGPSEWFEGTLQVSMHDEAVKPKVALDA